MTSILCSWCHKDLSTTTHAEDWRIALVNERITHEGTEAITDLAVAPILEQEHRFCSLDCLSRWSGLEHASAVMKVINQSREQFQEWKQRGFSEKASNDG